LTTQVVGVVCALQGEARHLAGRTTLPRHASVAARADGTLLTIAGMGGAAAALGASNLVDAGAAALVSWGMAGGLDPALAAGRIFLPSEVAAIDGPSVATAQRWREQLSAALAAHQPLTCGKLLTSSRAIASVAAKAALFRQTGAAAVDMESLSVAQVALAHGLPFIAVRVIVDGAGDDLPAAVSDAADASRQLRVWRLLGQMLLAPAAVMPVIRLTRRYAAASRSLAAVARAGHLAPETFALGPDTGSSQGAGVS
jgi:adenosylhomocysteine nucleosidase